MSSFRGFSLVEVMTVIAIVGIMLGITFVSFSGRRDEESLKGAAREVAAAVRSTQSNALSGVKRGVPEPPPKSLCWIVLKKASSTSYEVFTRYKNTATDDCDTEGFNGTSETYALPNGVSFSGDWNMGGAALSFDVPRGDYREADLSNIVLTKGGEHVSVCVLPSGVVIEKPVGTFTCP
jgi:prepilin-type N-terminal cleavage/methylation domain-containing protein